MLMKQTAIAAALCLASSFAQAAFVDARTAAAGGQVEVAFKSISMGDLVAELAPNDFKVEFAEPSLRDHKVSVSGKGTWQEMIAKAGAASGLRMDMKEKVVNVGRIDQPLPQPVPASIVTTLPVAVAPAAKPAALAAVTPATPVVAAKPAQSWTVTVADKSVRALLERWSKTAGYQLLWEIPVDLELNATVSVTGSFEEALTAVLASLKNSAYPIEAMIYENRVVRMVKRIPKEK